MTWLLSLQVVGLEEFRRVVMEDAQEVKLRQETDSISVVDDIRYHISANARTFVEASEASRKLGLIDDLLSSLGLEAWFSGSMLLLSWLVHVIPALFLLLFIDQVWQNDY